VGGTCLGGSQGGRWGGRKASSPPARPLPETLSILNAKLRVAGNTNRTEKNACESSQGVDLENGSPTLGRIVRPQKVLAAAGRGFGAIETKRNEWVLGGLWEG